LKDNLIEIRPYRPEDEDALWRALQEVVSKGEAFATPPDMSREDAIAFWFAKDSEVFTATLDGEPAGSYYLRANQMGGGAHVANCGYLVQESARGKGIARLMGEHSIATAKDRGYRTMQFNFVVSTNESAVHLWQSLGFAIVGTLPGTFHHPRLGYVDSYVMMRPLVD
jgi:GNAT superfamily N-acetyltransferase